ncbi:MAG: hypothetical protein M3Y08_00590 [Fibrobacterota bacterium]|nr:hypothetical protein [Fibrobacterota bacterium]
MKAFLLAFIGFIPSLTLAVLCDDTYTLQSVSQTLMVGNNPDNLTKSTKSVLPDLSNLDIISATLNYKIITRFEGSCTKAPKPVVFRQKPSGKMEFTDITDNGYQIQMYDSKIPVDSYKYDYWFGFYFPAESLIAYLGRTNSKSDAFVNHYAMVSYIDSTFDPIGGQLKTDSSGFVGPSGPADSASLHNRLLEATGRKNIVQNGNRKIKFTVQMLEVRYENKPAPISISASKKAVPRFQASQTGNLVLIRLGEKKSVGSTSLDLYGMMGQKIATLHPTGNSYQWNGKTSFGADAPTGVYFVQSSGKILGKFFFTR